MFTFYKSVCMLTNALNHFFYLQYSETHTMICYRCIILFFKNTNKRYTAKKKTNLNCNLKTSNIEKKFLLGKNPMLPMF